MSEKIYLVPHDFSKAADNAVRQACVIANKADAVVLALHIVGKQKDVEPATKKLQAHFDKSGFNAKNAIQLNVVAGDIFVDIAKVAKERGAHVIVMGTHGAKGMQKVFGSFAIKVINSTEVPFIIVQEDTSIEETRSICAPINETSESLQIVPTAMEFAQVFGAKLHMIVEKDIYAGYTIKIKTRMQLLSEKFEKYGIDYDFKTVTGSGSYSDKVQRYVKNNDIDYLAVTYFSDALLPQFDTYTQNLIMNDEKKPIVIIRGKDAGNAYF